MKISNIRVIDHAEKITIECPDCCNLNKYFVHPQGKFEVIRTCYECGAILMCEVENETTE